MESATVVVVAADSISRRQVEDALNSDRSFVIHGIASNGHEGIKMVERIKPDLVLVESALPGLNGESVTTALSHAFPDTLVVLMSEFADYDHLVASACSGAAAMISRRADRLTLLRSLQALLKERTRMKLWSKFRADTPDDSEQNGTNHRRIDDLLTSRQISILDCMLLGMSFDQMLAELQLSKFTLRRDLTNMFRALDVHNKVRAITASIERGWSEVGKQTPSVSVVQRATRSEPIERGDTSFMLRSFGDQASALAG